MKKDDSDNMFNEPVARWAVYREGVDDVIGEYGYSRNIKNAVCIYVEESNDIYFEDCFEEESVEFTVVAFSDETYEDEEGYGRFKEIGRKKVRIKFKMDVRECP